MQKYQKVSKNIKRKYKYKFVNNNINFNKKKSI